MRSSVPRVATTIFVGLLLVACAPAASPAPITTPTSEPASTGTSAMPSPIDFASSAPTVEPTLPPLPASASLPVRASARENSDHTVMTAPGPERGVYVLIPMRTAPAVLALLDSTGRPTAGWPVVVPGARWCDQLLPVEDGSVRLVCTMENPDGNMFDPIGAFAFDPKGRLLAGWPVALDGYYFTGQVAGDDLVVLLSRALGDVDVEGRPSFDVGLVSIAADGSVGDGERLTDVGHCCMWAVGPDGIAYGVDPASSDPSPQTRNSRITAVDLSGQRAGWPVSLEGITSSSALGPGGQAAVTVASVDGNTSRVVVFGPDGRGAPARSAPLPIRTAEYTGDTGGCTAVTPRAPVVATDGTTFVYSELEAAVYAVDPSLATMSGWPFEPDAPLAHARPGFEHEHEAGYCPAPVIPAVGRDRTLYLPLRPGNGSVGGSLVAIGPDGRVRPGWPVELKRPGAEFWSVVVGSDGTAYALAIEPESGGRSSATILVIAPDGTVLYTTTLIEP